MAQGMQENRAYQFAAQSCIWKCEAAWRQVCIREMKGYGMLPAGATIEGVRILEKTVSQSSCFEALQGAADKKMSLLHKKLSHGILPVSSNYK